MSRCSVCAEARSPYILNNRTVCLRCDELMFDLEIECEELALPKRFKEKKSESPETEAPNSTSVKKTARRP